MSYLNLNYKTLSTALLSSCLAGGVIAYSSAAAADDSRSSKTQAQATTTTKTQSSSQQTASKQSQSTASSGQNNTSKEGPNLSQVDENEDAALVWTEIHAIYDDELSAAGWNEEYVFDTYDENEDQTLNESEYVVFLSGLSAETIQHANPTGSGENAWTDQRENQQRSASNNQSDRIRINNDQKAPTASTNSNQQRNQQASTSSQQQDQQRNQESSLTSAGAEQQQNQQRSQQSNAASTGSGQQQNQQRDSSLEQVVEPAAIINVVAVTEIPVEQITDREVINYRGESLGDVEEVVVQPDGSISGLVVGVGGFWGIGEKNVFVPAEEVRAAGDYIVWETFLDEDALEDMPQYQLEEYSAVTQ